MISEIEDLQYLIEKALKDFADKDIKLTKYNVQDDYHLYFDQARKKTISED